jgi:hypothetical protein
MTNHVAATVHAHQEVTMQVQVQEMTEQQAEMMPHLLL